jgi:hypothetical protein
VVFVDVAQDDKISAGDYWLVTYTGTAGTSMQLNLLYGSEAKSIASANWNSN